MRAPSGARQRLLLTGVLALVLLLVLGGGYVWLRGDDAAPGSAGTDGETTEPTPDGSGVSAGSPEAPEEPDPLDDPMSPESIDLRYERLSGAITTGTDDCRSAKVRDGQVERLRCDVPSGTLELVTYTKTRALVARREEAVTDEPGGVLDTSRTRTMMAFQGTAPAKKGNGDEGGTGDKGDKGDKAKQSGAGQTYLYWDDDRARQSATYRADAGTDLAVLAAAYDATDPVRPYPTGLSNKQLVAFARRWVGSGDCLRTVTINPGALEESYCDVKGPVEVFVGRFATMEELKAYRTLVVASAIADKREVRTWSAPKGGDPVGALYEYTTNDGTVARYWDDSACLCYAEAFLAKGSYARLARWWDQ